MPVPADAGLVTRRLADGLSQTNTDVFHGMMLIDLQVALRLYREVDDGVTREQLQHVVEKAHTGGNLRCSVTV